MHKKALTVAIAGALAAPLAAQAVDFTLSGQVSRTLFINDSDTKTSAEIRDNNGATRIRANGHSVLEDGSTLGIQFEYTVGSGPTKADGAPTTDGKSIALRHANVQYTNTVAGRITFGHGFEAGEGSSYLGPSVTGLGAGQDGTSMGSYFSSLDGGARRNMVRYDTPTIGPLRAAVSLGNNDSVSGLVAVSSEFSGMSFGAQAGTVQAKGEAGQTSASFGVTLASGLSVGGAWGRGENLGATDMVPGKYATGCYTDAETGSGDTLVEAGTLVDLADTVPPQAALDNGVKPVAGDCPQGSTMGKKMGAATPADPGDDPSYFRLGIGYTFGGTTVAASWYNSEDFVSMGSEGTAFGIGASHALPKVGATFHASVQNYEVEMMGGASMDETVFQLGTVVAF